jgi:hypothetical protein
VWSKKTVLQWQNDCGTLTQLREDEILKRTELRNAATLWQSDVDRIKYLTRTVATLGAAHFSNDPDKQENFTRLRTDARGRVGIEQQGHEAHDGWMTADATWVPDDGNNTELSAFASLLAACHARHLTHITKLTAWQNAAMRLLNKARVVDKDNVAWYLAATRRFPRGTTEGDLIRTAVPTTTRTMPAVGQAVISNLMVAGGDIHMDADAPHATRMTFLQQVPGSPVFLVVQAESTEMSLTLHDQPPGLHRFKAYGSSSRGNGPESVIAEATVAQQAAA